jgi:hypothetical protein
MVKVPRAQHRDSWSVGADASRIQQLKCVIDPEGSSNPSFVPRRGGGPGLWCARLRACPRDVLDILGTLARGMAERHPRAKELWNMNWPCGLDELRIH